MKLFRRLAGHSPWAVAAACALGLTRPIPAQSPLKTAPAAVPVAEARDGDAVNIQVAWLGDPALFGCSLVCRPVANGLELAGFVPSEPVRQRALHIARSLTEATIVDHLKVQQGMPLALPRPAAPAELAPQASALLAEALGDKVLGLRVVCPSDGRVEINGTVPAAADKLLVSKTLKKLRGCTQVVNKIGAPASSEEAAVVSNIPVVDSLPAKESSAEDRPAVAAATPVAPTMPPPPAMTMAPPPLIAPPKITPSSEPKRVVERMESVPPAMAKSSPPRLASRPPAVTESAPVPSRGNWAQPQVAGRSSKTETTMPVPPPRSTKAAEAAAANDLVMAEMTGPKLAGPPAPMGPPAPVPPPAVVPASADLPAPLPPAPKPLIAEPIISRPEPPATPRPTKPPLPKPILPDFTKPKPIEPAVAIKPDAKPAAKGYGVLVKGDAKPRVTPKPPEPLPAAFKAAKTEPPKAPADHPETPKTLVLPPVVTPTPTEPTAVAGPAMPLPAPVVVAPVEKPNPAPTVEMPKLPESIAPVVIAPKVDVPKPAPVVESPKLPDPVVVVPKIETKPEPMVVVENPPALVGSDLMPPMPRAIVAAPPPPKPVVAATPVAPVVISKSPEAKKLEPMTPAHPPLVIGIPESPKRLDLAPRPAPVPIATEPKRLDLPAVTPKVPTAVAPSRIEFAAAVPKLTERAPLPNKAEAPRPLTVIAPAEVMPVTESVVKSAKHDADESAPPGAGTSFKGVIRQTAQTDAPTLDSDTVRRAVEDMCRGRANDVHVTPGANRAMTVAVRVRSQGEWDRLCKDIKALPEVSGYSIVYDVSVAGNAKRNEPMPGDGAAPLMGVLRSGTTIPAVGPDTVRSAIENACRGRADDVTVRPNARQQVSVSLKVRSAAEWDRLYKEIKAMPEVAGYAVIYNVAVKAN